MTSPQPRLSVVIPAHNEGAVINRCLRTLLIGTTPGEIEVVVVPNGCTDETAAKAEQFGRESQHEILVAVVDKASKIAALRVADATATVFPRAYLDADIEVSGADLFRTAEALRTTQRPAGRPALRYESAGASPLVRRYYRARQQVPALTGALWGAGLFMLTATGRARFGDWPDVVGDDLFVDSQFSRDEVFVLETGEAVVRVPADAATLLAVCTRAQRGKREQLGGIGSTSTAAAVDSTGGTARGLLGSVISRRVGLIDAAVFVGFAVAARARARRSPGGIWERDDSSRALP